MQKITGREQRSKVTRRTRGKLLREFQGTTDLIRAKLSPVKRLLSDDRTQHLWAALVLAFGLTAMFAETGWAAVVGLLAARTFLPELFMLLAANLTPIVMIGSRLARLFSKNQ